MVRLQVCTIHQAEALARLLVVFTIEVKWGTPPKTNMDTNSYGLEKVILLNYGHFWYQFVKLHPGKLTWNLKIT